MIFTACLLLLGFSFFFFLPDEDEPVFSWERRKGRGTKIQHRDTPRSAHRQAQQSCAPAEVGTVAVNYYDQLNNSSN